MKYYKVEMNEQNAEQEYTHIFFLSINSYKPFEVASVIAELVAGEWYGRLSNIDFAEEMDMFEIYPKEIRWGSYNREIITNIDSIEETSIDVFDRRILYGRYDHTSTLKDIINSGYSANVDILLRKIIEVMEIDIEVSEVIRSVAPDAGSKYLPSTS